MTVLRERDAFTPQTLFHDVGAFKVPLTGERAKPVDYAMAGQPTSYSCIECPSNAASRAARAKVFGDVAVRRDLPWWDLGHDVPHALKEILSIVGHDNWSIRARRTREQENGGTHRWL
jgi:hypothetical protein